MKSKKITLNRLSITIIILVMLITLPSSGPSENWGVPITPGLLAEQGKLDVDYPSEAFPPGSDWEQSWRIWLPGRPRPNKSSGSFTLKKKNGTSPGKDAFHVLQVISEDNSWLHATRAEITTLEDLWATPVHWRKSTAYYHSPQQGNQLVEDIGTFQEDSLPQASKSQGEHFVAGFTLVDVIQRMSLDEVDQLEFTLLDELDKTKENHRLHFLEETSIYFAGKERKVRCYAGIGNGMLPWKYYVSEDGWLLLAISGMRTYILDPGCEKEYMERIDDQALAFSARKESRPVASDRRGAEHPNILFITTDQQTRNTISANGNQYLHTPGLNRIARAGVSFRYSYSPNPVCSPTRASWLTGLTTSENGVISNGLDIIEGIETVADRLTAEGYETVFAGKLHVGIPDSYRQQIPGFSKVLCAGIGGKGTLGDQVVSSVCQGYLQNRDRSKPFFMAVHFLQPHDICNWISRNNANKEQIPYLDMIADELPPLPGNYNKSAKEPSSMNVYRNTDWDDKNWQYYLWSYYRMIEEADAEIGRILSALEQSGEAANTVVIFNSDHGEGSAHHSSILKNYPYEEACRVPFLISYPEELLQGYIDNRHLVSGLDVVPTICDFAGTAPPDNYRGLSIRKIAAGKEVDWRDFVVTEVNHDRGRMIRTMNYKLIAYRDDPEIMFFDMVNDPGETRNLAHLPEYRAEIDRHIELLEQWEQRLNPAPNAIGPFTVSRE